MESTKPAPEWIDKRDLFHSRCTPDQPDPAILIPRSDTCWTKKTLQLQTARIDGRGTYQIGTSPNPKEMLAKEFCFAISSKQLLVVDLTATETMIGINKQLRSEVEQISMISAALLSAKTPPSNLTIHERKAITSLINDQSITILPVNSTDYHSKMTPLGGSDTYEILGRDSRSSYKRRSIIACN